MAVHPADWVAGFSQRWTKVWGLVSPVSARFFEESAQELERPAAGRFDDLGLLITYLDALVFGDHHVI